MNETKVSILHVPLREPCEKQIATHKLRSQCRLVVVVPVKCNEATCFHLFQLCFQLIPCNKANNASFH